MASRTAVAARPRSVVCRLGLKPDLESPDDKKVAHAEIESIFGEKTVFGAAGAEVVIQDVKDDVAFLQRRLAFWKTIDVGGMSVENTQSQQLENTARAKAVWSNGLPTFHADQLQIYSRDSVDGQGPTPALRRKNDYLCHPFHKYKAKFFPRLARALINIACPVEGGVILDPFCGSGTACVEASFMGVRSIGTDIDPLSVFISKIKTQIENLDVAEATRISQKLVFNSKSDQLSMWDREASDKFNIPAFLLARQPKRLPAELATEIETEVSVIRSAINEIKDLALRDLYLMILSHAISTKISLRWMGTGDDRFALEIASRSVSQIFRTHSKMVLEKLSIYQSLRSSGILQKPASSQVTVADAIRLPLADNSIDGIATSPPYLPAASGRETYLRSRASAIMAIGLMTEAEILETETRVLGSILARADTGALHQVPETVRDLVEWMLPQRERVAKANPTLAYFLNLRLCLLEMRRVLKPGGKVALVVSKEHTFWALTSREILRKFDMAGAIAEMATEPRYGIGFHHDKTIDIELPKMDYAARPGAKGIYSESIIILRK